MVPTGNCWTTSFRTGTASSSSRCMAAKGHPLCLGPLGVGRAERSAAPGALHPGLPVPLGCLPTLYPELPPGREKSPGAENELGKAGRRAGAWAGHSFSQQLRWGRAPLSLAGVEGVCVARGPSSSLHVCL